MPRHKSISDADLLDRALAVMGRAGPGGFTLADIAREVGVSPATLPQRFGDKQTLVERAFSRDNERFAVWLKELPAGVGVDAVVRIHGEATRLFGDKPSMADHLLWLREDIRDPSFNRLALRRFTLFRAEIVKRLPKMRVSRTAAARLLDAQYHGAVIQWTLERKGRRAAFVTRSLRDWFRLGGL